MIGKEVRFADIRARSVHSVEKKKRIYIQKIVLPLMIVAGRTAPVKATMVRAWRAARPSLCLWLTWSASV